MNIIKTDLRNKMCDDWLNDLMICYVFIPTRNVEVIYLDNFAFLA